MLVTTIVIVIIILLYLCCSNTTESFSTSKTNVVFSDFAVSDASDKYANVNEEILVITQVPGVEVVTMYKYLRTQPGKYLAMYAKKEDGATETIISTIIVKMDKTVSEIMPVLKKSGILDVNTKDTVNYYVKLLTDPKYQAEQAKLTNVKEVYRKYNLCVKSRFLSSGAQKAMESCKKEYNI